jgi:hypothetical protein
MTNSFRGQSVVNLTVLAYFRFICALRGAHVEQHKSALRFQQRKPPTSCFQRNRRFRLRCVFCFHFLHRTSFQFYGRVHFNACSCSNQVAQSTVRHPRSGVCFQALTFKCRIVLNRRQKKNTSITGKVCVFILCHPICFCCRSYRSPFVLFCLFQVPAHILCLTVASGWNKERCTPEIAVIVYSSCRTLSFA